MRNIDLLTAMLYWGMLWLSKGLLLSNGVCLEVDDRSGRACDCSADRQRGSATNGAACQGHMCERGTALRQAWSILTVTEQLLAFKKQFQECIL